MKISHHKQTIQAFIEKIEDDLYEIKYYDYVNKVSWLESTLHSSEYSALQFLLCNFYII
jgi:hypothetical protein